ncbi:MAG: type II secretion system protein M [Thiobacillus sp.]|nr:type II secretion system protein M [Thiobacillus sp.]
MIKERWAALSTRISGMSPRERGLIFVALLVVVLALAHTLIVDPVQFRKNGAKARVEAAQSALQTIDQQQRSLTGQHARDPDQAAKNTLAEREARLAALNAEIGMRERSLIPPAKMAAVLQDVVREGSGVKVVGIKTLSPQPVALEGAVEGAPPGFYRHGFEVKVKGSYASLVSYLARLEALPWRLNWVEVSLDTKDRPELTLTLTVHTLSLEEAWLRV